MGAISQFHDSRRCLTLKLYRHTADSEWRESKGELLVPKNELKKAQPSNLYAKLRGGKMWKIKKNNLPSGKQT